MSRIAEFAESILRITESVRSGKTDPLEVRLTPEYKKLQKLNAETGSRLDIDEMLNEVLRAKVDKVQELARVLASPELYVSKLKGLNARQLAGMIVYHRPIQIVHLDHPTLERSSERIKRFIEKLGAEPPPEKVPSIAPLPNGFTFASEDAILIEDANRFAVTIPEGSSVSIDDLILCDSFDEFLRRFLYLVILISKGILQYDTSSRSIIKNSQTKTEEASA